VRVYADETRPLLQGSRLTARELARAGIPVHGARRWSRGIIARARRDRPLHRRADRIAAQRRRRQQNWNAISSLIVRESLPCPVLHRRADQHLRTQPRLAVRIFSSSNAARGDSRELRRPEPLRRTSTFTTRVRRHAGRVDHGHHQRPRRSPPAAVPVLITHDEARSRHRRRNYGRHLPHDRRGRACRRARLSGDSAAFSRTGLGRARRHGDSRLRAPLPHVKRSPRPARPRLRAASRISARRS